MIDAPKPKRARRIEAEGPREAEDAIEKYLDRVPNGLCEVSIKGAWSHRVYGEAYVGKSLGRFGPK